MISNILNITYYTILRNFRDMKSMINMLLLPIILIIILGNALSGAYEVTNVGKTKVVYINKDKGEVSKAFDSFLEIDEIKEYLEVEKAENYDEGLKTIQGDKAKALILIDSDFSDKIKLGQKADIQVIANRDGDFRVDIIKNIVDSFIQEANRIEASSKLGDTRPTFQRTRFIEKKPISASKKIPGSMDYYSVTMLVLILMYGAMYGIHCIAEDYLESMGKRLKSAPVPLWAHFTGKTIGIVATVFAQAIIIICFTKYVYKSNWGNNMPGIILIAFTLSAFAIMLGIMTTMLARDKNIATAIVNTIIPVMTFVSGGYMKIASDSSIYNAVKFLLPSNLGQTAFFNLIYSDSIDKTIYSTAMLWLMIIIMGVAALIAGRRKLQ